MKKLMIIAVGTFATLIANASTYNWCAKTGYLYMPGTTDTKITSGATAYLFDDATISQTALLTALLDGTYANVGAAFAAKGVSTAATTAVNSSARFDTSADFEWGTAGDHDFYAVIVSADVADAVYFTSTKTVTGSAVVGDTSPIKFGSMTSSSQAAVSTDTTVSGGGWYSTADVPEPTSGLLMLLGVAGLALRRKRA